MSIFFRLSGYSRPSFDADLLCDRCEEAWENERWFWRWCRPCRQGRLVRSADEP